MKTSYSILKRQLFIAGITVAGALTCSSAVADAEGGIPSAADETTPSMSTLRSLDRFTGGFKGWGPLANPQVPSSPGETREQQRQSAEVDAARASVWAANASLRAPYELQNIGATKAAAAQGEYRFDSNQPR